ncbi:MAG: hypothetical protein WCI39_01910 [Gallionellaceae bacterium]
MKKLFNVLVVAALLIATSSAFSAERKVASTINGNVSGKLSYAAMQFSLISEKEVLCVMVDFDDEEKLQSMLNKKVTFTGPIQTWSDKKRCIVVGPDFPKPVK